MNLSKSKAEVLRCLGLLLVIAGCTPRESSSVSSPATNATRVVHAAKATRAGATSTRAKSSRVNRSTDNATPPLAATTETGDKASGPERPRSVLAAMNAIRRATTETERRRAVTAFVSNASFMANNPASVEMLLDTLKLAPEHDVIMAVQQVLGQAPDTAVPFMAALLYHDATTAEERERLLGVIRHAQTPAAVSMLTGLADTANGRYADPLPLSAIDTLGVIGTPAAVRDLTCRIEAAAAQGQDVQPLVEALSRTINPASYDLLAAAARGDGTVNPLVRLAALNALGHYPTVTARATLNQIIAQEADADLLAAAKSALKRASLDLPADFGTPPSP